MKETLLDIATILFAILMFPIILMGMLIYAIIISCKPEVETIPEL